MFIYSCNSSVFLRCRESKLQILLFVRYKIWKEVNVWKQPKFKILCSPWSYINASCFQMKHLNSFTQNLYSQFFNLHPLRKDIIYRNIWNIAASIEEHTISFEFIFSLCAIHICETYGLKTFNYLFLTVERQRPWKFFGDCVKRTQANLSSFLLYCPRTVM